MKADSVRVALSHATQSGWSAWLVTGVLSLVLSAPLQAQFSYVTNNGGIVITGYSGSGGVVTIPSSITGLPVTGIGDSVFKQNFDLTSVTIPDTVTSIGNSAFDSCIFLTQVIIPDSVTNIGVRAFQVCYNVTNVILGDGLLTIGDSAFWSMSALNDLVLGSNITSIGGHAFKSTALTSVRIPDSVTSMGGSVFQFCEQLTNVIMGSGLSGIPANAFKDDFALVSVEMGTNLTSIGSQALSGTGLVNVEIPDSVTLIDISAFNDNPDLVTVVVGSGVTSIGITAFASCGSMTGIYFKGNAPGVGSFAFSGDTATVYYLPWRTGWTSTFGGLSTAPWTPPVEPAGPTFGAGGFGFIFVGLSNQTVVVEASTDLFGNNWIPISTNTLSAGPNHFHDVDTTNFATRFYRLNTQ